MIPFTGRALLLLIEVLSSWWMLGAGCLVVGREGLLGHEHNKVQRMAVVFLLPVFTSTCAICRLGWFRFLAFLRAHTYFLQLLAVLLVLRSFRVLVLSVALGCSIYLSPVLLTSVSFGCLPLCPSFGLAPIPFLLAMGSGVAVPCYFGVGLSAFTFLYEKWCPHQFGPTWLERVDPSDPTVEAAGVPALCVGWRAGVFVFSLVPPGN